MKFLYRAAAPLAAGFALLFTAPAMADGGGAVYTQTNAPTGNAVHRLDRGPDGLLTPVATYRTGGTGTGATLSLAGRGGAERRRPAARRRQRRLQRHLLVPRLAPRAPALVGR